MRWLAQATILKPEEIERLAKLGISNLSQVIDAINEPHERYSIARLTGISEETLWQLACIADLCRIPGLGPKRALLLSQLKCACTTRDLAECDPHELSLKLAVRFTSLTHAIPSIRQLKRYIEGAQTTAPLLQPTSAPSEIDREFETVIATQVSNAWQVIRVFGILLGLVLAAVWVGLLIWVFHFSGEMHFVFSGFPNATELISQVTWVLIVWALSLPAAVGGIFFTYVVLVTLLCIGLYRLVNRRAFRSRRHKLLAIEARSASMKAYGILRTWIRSHARATCGLLAAILVGITLLFANAWLWTENVDIEQILTIASPVLFVTFLAIWTVAFRSELREVRKMEGWSRSFERRYVFSEVGFHLAEWTVIGVGFVLTVWLAVNVLGMITINSLNNLAHAVSSLAQFMGEYSDQFVAAISSSTQQLAQDFRLEIEVAKTALPPLIWKGVVWWLALSFGLALARLLLIQGRKALIFIAVSAGLGWVWEAILVERLPNLLGIGRSSPLAWAVRLTVLPLGFFITDYIYEWMAAEEATCPACEWDTEPGDRYCAHCGSRLDRFLLSTPAHRRLDRLYSLAPFLRRNTTHSRDTEE